MGHKIVLSLHGGQTDSGSDQTCKSQRYNDPGLLCTLAERSLVCPRCMRSTTTRRAKNFCNCWRRIVGVKARLSDSRSPTVWRLRLSSILPRSASTDSNGYAELPRCYQPIIADISVKIPSHQALTMQLLGPSDMTLDTTASPRTDFDYYVSSYVLSAPTEGIGAKVSAPLLKR